MKERIILHIDVNNAFLSWTAVDMLKHGSKTDIRNRYAIIGGDESKRRGIVLAKSNPCKQKGVITSEPIWSARRKCPYLEVYRPDFKIYNMYSNMFYNYLLSYTNVVERYSIDECFVDYSDLIKLHGDPIKTAYKIKNEIKEKFGFTVNVGIGNNKLCAKMSSDFTKPDKVHTLFKDEIEKKMWPLPIEDLFMTGKKTSEKLRSLNINTIGDLAKSDKAFIEKNFKKLGTLLWEYANGIDNSNVEYTYESPKSISTSTVLPYNYTDKTEIYNILKQLSMDTGKRLRNSKLYAKTVSIWIKYSDLSKFSKQIKLDNNTSSDEEIYHQAIFLFNKIWNEEPVRGLCVGVSDLDEYRKEQLSIFDTNNNQNEEKLQKAIDEIKNKFGNNFITYADVNKNNNIMRERISKHNKK